MPEKTMELPPPLKDDSIKLTFSFPDVITVGHYQIYAAARLKYIDEQRGQPAPSNMAAYMGARALIQAGIVHIKSDDPTAQAFVEELKAVIQNADQTNTPVSVMQLIGGVIASKVEAETLNPTLFGKSFSITTDRSK